MNRKMGKNKNENRDNNQIKNVSRNGVRVLDFPENSFVSKKNEVTHSTLLKSKLRPSQINFAHDEQFKKEEGLVDREGELSTLEELEEKEKRLKYHIRELESFFGLT